MKKDPQLGPCPNPALRWRPTASILVTRSISLAVFGTSAHQARGNSCNMIERSLEVKLPTYGRMQVSPTRKRATIERRSEERRSKHASREVAKHGVFKKLCGSGGSKGRLKRCGEIWRHGGPKFAPRCGEAAVWATFGSFLVLETSAAVCGTSGKSNTIKLDSIVGRNIYMTNN